MPKIEYICQCDSCAGTGLYKGFAEGAGAAVVCCDCKGTGKQCIKITYNNFTGRKIKKGVERVYLTNCGFGIGTTGITEKGEKLTLEYFGGMPYKDWKSGKRFPKKHEMRKLACPAQYYQSADYNKKPDWEECIACGTFSSCKSFNQKEKCWVKWDKLIGGKK